MNEQKKSLLNNSRFYILATSLLVSIAVVSYLRLQITSDQLYYIRLQQVFGLLSLLFWYFALIISPIGHIIGKHRTKRLEFSRRAIGVSAFYFALLHAVVALWGQLGGLSELKYLPSLYTWSLIGGGIALCILFIMAMTSFDKVVRFMTFRKWKWLHRLVYIGGILAILHIWLIGTHLVYTGVQITAYTALVILVGLELYRTIKLLNAKYLRFQKKELAALFVVSWLCFASLLFVLPSFLENSHTRHADQEHEVHAEELR